MRMDQPIPSGGFLTKYVWLLSARVGRWLVPILGLGLCGVDWSQWGVLQKERILGRRAIVLKIVGFRPYWSHDLLAPQRRT